MKNKLPEEILNQIKKEAQSTLTRASRDLTYSAGYYDGYSMGATEWAQWFIKHNAIESENNGLKAENERLKGWKVKYDELKARCEKMESLLKYALDTTRIESFAKRISDALKEWERSAPVQGEKEVGDA